MPLDDKEYLRKVGDNRGAIEGQLEQLRRYDRNYGLFWAESRKMLEVFRTCRPLLAEDREKLWREYSELCESVKHEMNESKKLSKENAEKIREEISELENRHCAVGVGIKYDYRFKEFWDHAKAVSHMFKTMKPLLKDERESLWENYSKVIESVKERQAIELEDSRQKRGGIEFCLREAENWTGGASNREELEEAREKHSKALDMIKEGRLRRGDREACWEKWNEVKEKIFYKRQEIQSNNYSELKDDASQCLNDAHYSDPYEAINDIKQVQQEMKGAYIDKSQRHELHDILSEAWEKAASKIGEMKEEKKRKYNEWKERLEGNIERWEGNIEKAEHAVEKIENNIEKLEDMISNARSEEYEERVRGWLDENYQKVEDIRESIKNWEDKIYSAKEKLGD